MALLQTRPELASQRQPTLETLRALKRRLGAVRRRVDACPGSRWLEVTSLDAEARGLRVSELLPAQEADAAEFVGQLDGEVEAATEALGRDERESLQSWLGLFQERARLIAQRRQLAVRAELDPEDGPPTTAAVRALQRASVERLELLRTDELPPFPRHWRAHSLLPGVIPTKEAALEAMQDLGSRELPVPPTFPLAPSAKVAVVAEVAGVVAAALLYFPFKLRLLGGLHVAAICVALLAVVVVVGRLALRARRAEKLMYSLFEEALTDYMRTVQCVVAWDADLRRRMRAEEQRQEILLRLVEALQAANEFAADLARGVRLASFEQARPELVEPIAILACAMRPCVEAEDAAS